jgi:hypothetical protein
MWRTRAASAVVAAAGLAMLAAACGGSPSSARGPASSESLAYSRCMRFHGVPSFPDPTGSGGIPKETAQQLGVADSGFQSAQGACAYLLPNGGGGPTAAELQQSWSDMASFARCMRSHGVPNWPDPTRYPPHPERPTFDLQSVAIDPSSPQLGTPIHDCVPLLHGNNPQHLGQT